MKLVFFGLSLSSSWGNGHATTYRSLLRGLYRRGHRIVFYERDVPWYAEHRDLATAEYAEIRLFKEWRQARSGALAEATAADATIVGSYCGEATAILDDLAARRPRRLAFYDIDTPVTIAALDRGECEYLRPDQLAAVDLYCSFTSGPMLDELSRRGARRVRALHCSSDPDCYRPEPAGARRWQLGYLGTYAPDREETLRRLLLEPARRLPHMRFAIGGPMYPDRGDWPANVEYFSHVPPNEHAPFYRSCRLALNVTRAEMMRWGYSPSIRLFEAAACATPILSDAWPGLQDFFRPGSEIWVADGTGGMVELLRKLPEDELLRVGNGGRRRVLNEHTGTHRAAALEGYLAEIRA